jgi:hypothetical protein
MLGRFSSHALDTVSKQLTTTGTNHLRNFIGLIWTPSLPSLQ